MTEQDWRGGRGREQRELCSESHAGARPQGACGPGTGVWVCVCAEGALESQSGAGRHDPICMFKDQQRVQCTGQGECGETRQQVMEAQTAQMRSADGCGVGLEAESPGLQMG